MPEHKGEEDWALVAARQFSESAQGMGLKVPPEAVAEVFRQIETIDIDLTGVTRVYNTEEAAQFLGRSPPWMYWALTPREKGGGDVFYAPDPDDPDAAPRRVEPERLPGTKGIRRYTLATIREMGVAMHHNATIDYDELKAIVRRIQLARLGRWQPVVKKKSKRKRKGKPDVISTRADDQGAN